METPIQAIKVRRLYLQVAQQLQQLIAEGTFPCGARLPAERDLATQFGVSRPTIREAMIALEFAGLVEVRSGSGVYVLEQTGKLGKLVDNYAPGPFEILEARRLIESEACALAARHINAGQLQRLETLLLAMEQGDLAVEDAEAADLNFHCVIAQASSNSALSAIVAWLWQLRNESEISTHFHQRIREQGSRPIASDHQLILHALQSGNAGAARKAMAGHLQRVIDTLMKTL